ncbi:MAG TPA: phosphotransferase [Iamia sp.]|nr:phosphotransferase [Iamia sp.]
MTDHHPPPRWAQDLLGPDARLVEVVSGGTSRHTLRLEVTPGGDRVVARHDPGAGPFSGTPLTLAREAATYAALVGSGVPVPAVVAVAADGRSFAVEEVPGTPEAGADSLDDLLTVLGRLHATGTRHVPPGHPGFDRAGEEDLALWSDLARRRIRRPAPLVDHALDRIAAHRRARPPAPVALCHGDPGVGNHLHRHGIVTGLVDWEMAHTGDPHDDLASVAVRAALVGVDLGDYRARVAARWEPVVGTALDPDRYRLGVAATLLRMVVSCLSALDHAAAGTDRSVQLLGLPVMEAQLLRALAVLDDRDPPPVIEAEPDPAFAAEVATTVAEALDGPGRDGPERRARYAARQLAAALAPRSPAAVPAADDPEALWAATCARLAVLPASRPLADRPIAGAA